MSVMSNAFYPPSTPQEYLTALKNNGGSYIHLNTPFLISKWILRFCLSLELELKRSSTTQCFCKRNDTSCHKYQVMGVSSCPVHPLSEKQTALKHDMICGLASASTHHSKPARWSSDLAFWAETSINCLVLLEHNDNDMSCCTQRVTPSFEDPHQVSNSCEV